MMSKASDNPQKPIDLKRTTIDQLANLHSVSCSVLFSNPGHGVEVLKWKRNAGLEKFIETPTGTSRLERPLPCDTTV